MQKEKLSLSTLENARNRALEYLATKLDEGAYPVIYGWV